MTRTPKQAREAAEARAAQRLDELCAAAEHYTCTEADTPARSAARDALAAAAKAHTNAEHQASRTRKHEAEA